MNAPMPSPAAATAVADQLSALASQLLDLAKAARADPAALGDRSPQRIKTVEACKTALGLIKSPMEEVTDRSTAMVSTAANRLFIKWKVFENIPPTGSISYQDLADRVGGDVKLITRVAWVLVAAGLLKQIGADEVAHTPRSLVFSGGSPLSALMSMGFDTHLRSLMAMPAYFEQHGLKEPTDRRKCIFSFAQGEPDATMWEVINRHPEQLSTFAKTMMAAENMYPVPGPYDFSRVVELGAQPEAADRALVVDVGGNKGHALKAIVEATPGLDMSRCVLEDLPDVIEATKQAGDAKILDAKLVGIDFHSEQPVKGAFIYYIRRCLHDYGDEDCVGVLRQIAAAMAPDSRLLIVELVIGNPPSPFAAACDFYMATLGGKERTYDMFDALVRRAGLALVGMNRCEGTDMGVLVCAREG